MTHRRQSAVKLLAALLLSTLGASAAQIKGAWVEELYYKGSTTSPPEVASKLDPAAAAGLNTVFLYTETKDLVAATNGGWNYLSNFIVMATARGLSTYFWCPNWKGSRAEITANPSWAAKLKDGTASEYTMCFNRPECRNAELALLTNLPVLYPNLAGIDLGEPFFEFGQCYCSYCTNYFWTNCAMNIMSTPAPANLMATQTVVYCAANGDFVSRLRTSLLANKPGFKLTCDGSFAGVGGDLTYNRPYGEDWGTWGNNGWIDFYLVQDYTSSTNTFVTRLSQTLLASPSVPVVAGVSIVSSGLINTPTVVGQEAAFGYNLAGGFSVFQADNLTTAYEQALTLNVATNILVRAKNLRIKNVVIR